jgi:hypothetical protein
VHLHLERRRRNPAALGCLRHGEPLKLDHGDGLLLRGRQSREQGLEIAPDWKPVLPHRGLVALRQLVERIVQSVAPALAPPEVDQLVMRNSQRPVSDRNRGVVRAALQVNRQQGLLHQVLHVVRAGLHPPPQEAAQSRGDAGQRLPIGGLVPRLGARPERLQSGLAVVRAQLERHRYLGRCNGIKGYTCVAGRRPRKISPLGL